MAALRTNPAQSLGRGSKWKTYVMFAVGVVTWILGLVLNFIGLDFISEIIYWMIWFFVYMNDIPKWITDPKILGTGAASWILGSIPGIGLLPWDTIAQYIIGKIMHRPKKS